MFTKIKKACDYLSSIDFRAGHLAAVFIFAFILTIARRPDIINYPQFWAEDGMVWFASAYNIGFWPSLLIPITGYFQTISRLAAGLSLIVPIAFAPYVFNLIAITIRVLPLVLLFSPRLKTLVPRFESKLLIAALYLALPNTPEIFANVTNAHSYLALLALMTALSPAPNNRAQTIIDNFIYAISALSGPFVIFMYPVIALKMYIEKNTQQWKRYGLLLFLGLIQLATIFIHAGGDRSAMVLGATPLLFVKIILFQVILGSILGINGTTAIITGFVSGSPLVIAFLTLICALSAWVLLTGFKNCTREIQLFTVFATLTFFAALIKPMASLTIPQWQILAHPGNGTRYWFFVMLAFLLILVSNVTAKNKITRLAAISILIIGIYGAVGDFRLDPWPNLNYRQQAADFDLLPSGTEGTIEILPFGWKMTLEHK